MCYNSQWQGDGAGNAAAPGACRKVWKKRTMESRRRKRSTRTFVTVLAALAAVLLAACGKAGTEGDQEASGGKEFVYVPEFTSLGGDGVYGHSDFSYAGGSLYYTAYTEDEGEALYQYDLTAKTARKLALPEADESRSARRILVDGEGNLYIIWTKYNYNEANPENSYMENSLAKYDAGGNQVFLNDITDKLRSDEDDGYVQFVALDSQGRIYVSTQKRVCLLDADGKDAGSVDVEGEWIQGLGTGKDGKVYMAYHGRNSGYVVAEVDFEKRSADRKFEGLPGNGNVMLSAGLEKDFLVSSSEKLYEYDKEAQASEEVLDWLDSDINGTYVEYTCATEDGKILAVTRDWGTDNTELVLLTKTRASEVQAKEEIVVGVVYMDQEIQAAAVAFNKGSDKYHVTIRAYAGEGDAVNYEDALAKLNSDIVSKDNCPDILSLDSLDAQHLSTMGAFEDLKPYLEKSSNLSEDSFLESILNAYTYDDRLVCIPKTFHINMLAGKKSLLGSATGWTIRDIMEFAGAHPDAQLLEYVTKAEMMEALMTFNQDAFIDWEKGSCSFDSEAFLEVLEFVGRFPDDYEGGDGESTQERLASGKLLLDTVNFSSLQDIQLYPAMFGEEVTFIGFPTTDGKGGCILVGSGSYAIASGSKHKDGAWSFIESYLSSKNEMFEWGLPTNRERFDALVEEELHVEYVKDENGELVLDEDGNPIPERGGGGLVMNGWEYNYRPATQEEIDILLAMIEVAEPVSMGNQDILKIIQEEAAAFYKGDKSAAEVAALIQSRVSMYVSENK